MSTAHYPSRPQGYQYPPQGHTTRYPPSSRSVYPTFLSLQDSLLLQLKWAWRGLFDAFRWNVVFSAVASDSEIRANVYKSLLLNSLSLLSIYVFDLLLQPLVQGQQKWFHRNIGWFYQVLWLLPVVGASLYLNGTWCTIIAKRTYLLQHGGRPVAPQSTSYTGMLKALATSAYRVVMVCTSVIFSFVLGKIPLLGPVAGFMFLCWVDAYYCFEFVWISRGLSLSSRIRHLEERWAYFFAFGFPSAALCTWGSTLANAALFALIFPAYIIMAMHARPVPADPYNPMPPVTPITASREDELSSPTIRHPSPLIPIRLPVFALVILLNDAIVKMLSFIGGGPTVRHKAATRSRAFSDLSSESAEDGIRTKMEMDVLNGSIPPPPGSKTRRVPGPATGRVKLGTRRKID